MLLKDFFSGKFVVVVFTFALNNIDQYWYFNGNTLGNIDNICVLFPFFTLFLVIEIERISKNL